MNSQLLPIGSVISLKGAERKLMTTGILVKKNAEDKVYDYIGLPYPEGYINSETMFLFMHEDIEEVHFLGFVNAEFQAFRSQLAKRVDNLD